MQQVDPASIKRAEEERDAKLVGMLRHKASDMLSPRWVSLGPTTFAGRNLALLTDPRNSNVLWAGSWAGLWKSTTAGDTWVPLDFFVGKRVSALARDPDVPSIIYAGTGWPDNTFSASYGALYRSIDDGATWGELTGYPTGCGIQSISLAAHYGKRILVGSDATIDHCSSGGIQLSTDFGTTWTTVLPTAEIPPLNVAGQSFAAFHPTDRNRAIAYVATSAGYGAYTSTDGGQTWTAAAGIPPATAVFSIAYAPSAPDTVYAVPYWGLQFGTATNVYRSTDGGANFAAVPTTAPVALGSQGHVHSLWVAPDDPNLIVIGNVNAYRSVDGGATIVPITSLDGFFTGSPHADILRVENSSDYGPAHRTVYLATDGGIYRANDIHAVSATRGWTPLRRQQSTMYYSVATGHPFLISTLIVGGMQDTGTSFTFPGITSVELGEGDSSRVAADPVDPSLFYAGLGSYILRCHFSAPCTVITPADFERAGDRSPWVLDPNDASRMFVAALAIHRTDDCRSTPRPAWTTIRAAGSEMFTALAVRPGASNEVWAGTAFGTLLRSENALDVSPVWSPIVLPGPAQAILTIWFDPATPGRVLVAGGFGHVFETVDSGRSWIERSGLTGATLPENLPVYAIVRHPAHHDLLLAGTLVGLYISEDDGLHWLPSVGVPGKVPVFDLAFFPGTLELVVATHGRGLWSADLP